MEKSMQVSYIHVRIERLITRTKSCWLWDGYRNVDGYGEIKIKGKIFKVHRIYWELHYGKIKNNLHVLHKCDVPYCINPKHLFLGTQKDNNDDKVKKNRHPKEERHGMAILNKDQVKDIRLRKKYRGYQYDLAKEFGVSQSLISSIVSKKLWKDV